MQGSWRRACSSALRPGVVEEAFDPVVGAVEIQAEANRRSGCSSGRCSPRRLLSVMTHLGNRLRSSYHLPDAKAGRAMSEGHWQLEGSAAELFQRYLVPSITLKWAEDLVRRAQLRTGELVLDVACGTGVVARLAATKVSPGQVTGLDLNAGMLAVARGLPNDGAPINWRQGSALDMPFPSGHFDVVLCQQGLQFFPDQPGALRELHRVLRERGRAALSVYSPIERTPGANAFVQALDQVLRPKASRIKRGEHSFANPGQLESLLRDAGFGTVVVSTVQQTIVFPSVLDYVRFQLVATPMTRLLKDKTEPEREAIFSSVASTAATLSTPAMLDGGKFAFPQEAYVAIASPF
jgi:ubiquinone/menaquinone biosynthesis C-methylase UbiE